MISRAAENQEYSGREGGQGCPRSQQVAARSVLRSYNLQLLFAPNGAHCGRDARAPRERFAL
jgi:hypothetical protein